MVKGYLVLVLLFPLGGYAQNMQQAFQQGMEEGSSHHNDGQAAANQYQPKDVFKDFDDQSEHYEQTKYYQGVEQSDTQVMQQDARQQMVQGDMGVVTNSIITRPQYKIDSQSADMQHATTIASEAQAIIHGTYPGCQVQQTCHPSYEQKYCQAPALPPTTSCKQNLVVEAKWVADHTRQLEIRLQSNLHFSSLAGSIDLKTGKSSWSHHAWIPSPLDKVMLSELIPELPCDQIKLEEPKIINNWPGHKATVKITDAPSCANHFSLGLLISASFGLDYTISYKLSTPSAPEITEHWVSECQQQDTWERAGVCHKLTEQCSKGAATHSINGIDVYRDCWQKKIQYECPWTTINSCQPLQEQHCEQIASHCSDANKVNGICVLSDQTYQCPVTHCQATDNIVCGDGQAFCLDGASCGDSSYQPNQNFEKSVAALNAVSAGDVSYAKDKSIFHGDNLQCREVMIGAINCCADKGWAKDIGLAACTQQEKDLGAAKEQSRVIALGRYCSHKPIFGICTEHKKSYCVFGSRLAMEVQNQGRRGQKGIGFGTPQNADCRGMTPDEFSTINFEQIDLRFMYQDIEKNMKQPDPSSMDQLVEDHIKQAEDPYL